MDHHRVQGEEARASEAAVPDTAAIGREDGSDTIRTALSTKVGRGERENRHGSGVENDDEVGFPKEGGGPTQGLNTPIAFFSCGSDVSARVMCLRGEWLWGRPVCVPCERAVAVYCTLLHCAVLRCAVLRCAVCVQPTVSAVRGSGHTETVSGAAGMCPAKPPAASQPASQPASPQPFSRAVSPASHGLLAGALAPRRCALLPLCLCGLAAAAAVLGRSSVLPQPIGTWPAYRRRVQASRVPMPGVVSRIHLQNPSPESISRSHLQKPTPSLRLGLAVPVPSLTPSLRQPVHDCPAASLQPRTRQPKQEGSRLPRDTGVVVGWVVLGRQGVGVHPRPAAPLGAAQWHQTVVAGKRHGRLRAQTVRVIFVMPPCKHRLRGGRRRPADGCVGLSGPPLS
ncbi:uncharacterized protein BJ171DRAFT_217064 [Polychytrium aggregatum]|uniref:uncharacterized protein n=1 Tax=Polychytrium aggregatum TaxID=110093 RepID=UPI0022FF1A4C|nr:uncharacterized protein BJ171DRAFT_217064 [Polychytrium aggregatum]KAI9199391.1 hypothetical protein BJ171DRAFT_217064 [Polychytrium aggregatum]